jgi:hypothetical protein
MRLVPAYEMECEKGPFIRCCSLLRRACILGPPTSGRRSTLSSLPQLVIIVVGGIRIGRE